MNDAEVDHDEDDDDVKNVDEDVDDNNFGNNADEGTVDGGDVESADNEY